MHHFIYPTKTTWISSGSRKTDGKAFTEQNFGKDEILELKKEFYNKTFDYPTRALVQFDLSEISKSIEDLKLTNEKITPNVTDNVGSKFYLRLYETDGNKEFSANYIYDKYRDAQDYYCKNYNVEVSPCVYFGIDKLNQYPTYNRGNDTNRLCFSRIWDGRMNE